MNTLFYRPSGGTQVTGPAGTDYPGLARAGRALQGSSGSARSHRPLVGQRRTGSADQHGSIPPRVIARAVVEHSGAGQVV